MKNLAPIVLFTYNKLDTLKKTVQHLKKNKLARKSNIFIYSDFYKTNVDKIYVLKVRKYLREVQGFKKKKIILRNKNYGLAKNIVNGVSEVMKNHSKAIILEDDILVSKYFLDYMNSSLNLYKKKKNIWHISGWNYNIKLKSEHDVYFTRTMNCWGWATWKDRWKCYKKNPKEIVKKWSLSDINKFNFEDSYNFFSQIERNLSGQIDTWAIFWYAVIFKNKGLCVNPINTLVTNIGVGKFATNTKSSNNIFTSNINDHNLLPKKFPNKILENKKIFYSIKINFLKLKIKNKIKNYIRKLI